MGTRCAKRSERSGPARRSGDHRDHPFQHSGYRHGPECGADNFLRKPYDPKGLLARIDNLLSNWELRQGNKLRMGLEIYLGGKKHFITSEREQILNLLISSYEQAIQVNEELKLREVEVEC
jgi:DNA-binding response OmpR family regulator